MAHYQVILAYDGTEFKGFQRQTSELDDRGVRTVQGVFEEALRQLGWQERSILAAGRTDTGVHATGQVVAFALAWKHSAEALQAALNASLPPDVAVQSVKPVDADFHPRYDAIARRYQYRVFCQEVRQPLKERYAWRVWPPIDADLLDQAASQIIGTHDFAAFGTPPRTGGSTIRTVSQAEWQVDRDGLVLEVVANAFLFHMVRRMVYLQVDIAQGQRPLDTIQDCLESKSPDLIRGLAPPQGLTLVEVMYPQPSPSAGREESG